MKKYTAYVSILVILIGIFGFVSVKQVLADSSPYDVGTCTVIQPYICPVPAVLNSDGSCTHSNWTRQSCLDNVTSGNTKGNPFTTVYPATLLGWCDVPGVQVYPNYNFYSCSIRASQVNWTTTAPALGWCTISGSSQITSGWTQYDCQLHPGQWSATDPNSTQTTGTTKTSTSGASSTTLTSGQVYCDYGDKGNGTGDDIGIENSVKDCANSSGFVAQTATGGIYCDYGANSDGSANIGTENTIGDCESSKGTPTNTPPTSSSSSTTPTPGTCDYGPDGAKDTNSNSAECTAANNAVGFIPNGGTEQYFSSSTATAGQVYCDYGDKGDGTGDDIGPENSAADCTASGGVVVSSPTSTTTNVMSGTPTSSGNTMSGTPNSSPTGTVKINNPIPNVTSIPSLIKIILQAVITMGIPIVALAIVYCGFLFVEARGNPEKLTKAKEALLWTIVGAAILLGALAIATMISATIAGLSS